MNQVRLHSETDFAGFRAQARALLARGVKPDEVEWLTPGSNSSLFEHQALADEPGPTAHVPPDFIDLCRTVILHSDPQRFALLYLLLWRLVHEPTLRHDPLDLDMLQARRMAKAVQRDIHKMHAFVRFRRVPEEGVAPADTLHVAWFEPDHHIVEHNAPWFCRRFANMRWAILSPECCIAWDRQTLTVRPGTGRENAPPPDAGEQLWLTYYRHIFNPARLKLDMMTKEMPRRCWHNLPEAALIHELAAEAAPRSQAMIENEATVPRRRIPIRDQPTVEEASDTAGHRSGARSLRALRAAVQQCLECPIGALATQGLCGEGNEKRPPLMFVGEQPGDREDLEGRPFVGPAGQLLDRAMAEAGIDRTAVFLSNAVRHFKFELRGKRRIHKSPTQREMMACHHWLEEEIGLVKPQALVALGATAAKSLLQRHVAVMSERGRWWPREDGLQVFVTVHPSSLLRLRDEDRDEALAAFIEDLRRAAAGPAA